MSITYLQEHTPSTSQKEVDTRSSRFSKRNVLLGSVAIIATAASVFGVTKLTEKHNGEVAAKFVATQAKLGPILRPLMVGIDKQMIAASKKNPNQFLVGRAGKDTVQILDTSTDNGGEDTSVTMGEYKSGPKKGQPNPNAPIYINSANFSRNGNFSNLSSFEISSPAGESYATQFSTLGGNPRGWTAVEMIGIDNNNSYAGGKTLDTTDPSNSQPLYYGNPSAVHVAHEIVSDWNSYGQI